MELGFDVGKFDVNDAGFHDFTLIHLNLFLFWCCRVAHATNGGVANLNGTFSIVPLSIPCCGDGGIAFHVGTVGEWVEELVCASEVGDGLTDSIVGVGEERLLEDVFVFHLLLIGIN